MLNPSELYSVEDFSVGYWQCSDTCNLLLHQWTSSVRPTDAHIIQLEPCPPFFAAPQWSPGTLAISESFQTVSFHLCFLHGIYWSEVLLDLSPTRPYDQCMNLFYNSTQQREANWPFFPAEAFIAYWNMTRALVTGAYWKSSWPAEIHLDQH